MEPHEGRQGPPAGSPLPAPRTQQEDAVCEPAGGSSADTKLPAPGPQTSSLQNREKRTPWAPTPPTVLRAGARTDQAYRDRSDCAAHVSDDRMPARTAGGVQATSLSEHRAHFRATEVTGNSLNTHIQRWCSRGCYGLGCVLRTTGGKRHGQQTHQAPLVSAHQACPSHLLSETWALTGCHPNSDPHRAFEQIRSESPTSLPSARFGTEHVTSQAPTRKPGPWELPTRQASSARAVWS